MLICHLQVSAHQVMPAMSGDCPSLEFEGYDDSAGIKAAGIGRTSADAGFPSSYSGTNHLQAAVGSFREAQL
jgi:hypothetical protein